MLQSLTVVWLKMICEVQTGILLTQLRRGGSPVRKEGGAYDQGSLKTHQVRFLLDVLNNLEADYLLKAATAAANGFLFGWLVLGFFEHLLYIRHQAKQLSLAREVQTFVTLQFVQCNRQLKATRCQAGYSRGQWRELSIQTSVKSPSFLVLRKSQHHPSYLSFS